jgi:hypothetical protein
MVAMKKVILNSWYCSAKACKPKHVSSSHVAAMPIVQGTQAVAIAVQFSYPGQ